MKNFADELAKPSDSAWDLFLTFRLARTATDGYWRLDNSSGYIYADTAQADANQMKNTIFGWGQKGSTCVMWGQSETGDQVPLGMDIEGHFVFSLQQYSPMNFTAGGSVPCWTHIVYDESYSQFLEWSSSSYVIRQGGTAAPNEQNTFMYYPLSVGP